MTCLATPLEKMGDLPPDGFAGLICLGGVFRWVMVPRKQWPDVHGFQAASQRQWHREVGDCRQEKVFIGLERDEIAIDDSLQGGSEKAHAGCKCILCMVPWSEFAGGNVCMDYWKWIAT
jgi:hypothetical protein